MSRWTVLGLVLVGGTASADEVTLANGSKFVGIIRENLSDPHRVELELGVGTVWFPRKEVLSTSQGRTDLHEYYERWGSVKDGNNVDDFLKLARFAEEKRLPKFVKGLMEIVLRLDSENETARRRLGFEKYQGKWMTRDELNRAKGLVLFEGRWATSAEKEIVLSERLEAKIRRTQAEEDRRRKAEEERLQRAERIAEIVASPDGYYYRPSEFWPYYYRGPRRPSIPGFGYLDAIPTVDALTVLGNPFAPAKGH